MEGWSAIYLKNKFALSIETDIRHKVANKVCLSTSGLSEITAGMICARLGIKMKTVEV